MDNPQSPITRSSNVVKIRSYDVESIVDGWKSKFSLDVRYLFDGIDQIHLFSCNDTGYKFYYPAIAGDSRLYENMQIIPGYYMPWKWEHSVATRYLTNGMCVLEIGCAEGHFLEYVSSRYTAAVAGIETNKKAIQKIREKGIVVYEESIQEHSVTHKNKYDVVCAFQVLEHIADVQSFIDSCLACLAPTGTLIISVPNNQSFISGADLVLNMPPHHVGLWEEDALRSMAAVFGLHTERIFIEPLQDYHLPFFKEVVYSNVLGERFLHNRIFRKMWTLLILKPFVDKHIEFVAKWVPGHTIIAVFRKA